MNPDEPMQDGGKRVVPQEPGIAYRLLSIKDARPHFVHVSFVPLRPDDPQLPSWRQTFPSRSLAQEFCVSLAPDPRPIGSPKQARAKRAARLRIPLQLLDLYQHKTEIFEVTRNDTRAPIVRGAFVRRPNSRDRKLDPTPDRGPSGGGPSVVDGGGLVLLNSILFGEEDRVRPPSEAPLDGEEHQGAETWEGRSEEEA